MKYALVLLLVILLVLLACAPGKVKLFDRPEDQYEYAKMLYVKGNYYLATEAFQTVIFRFHGTSLADSVTFYMGMCYYNQEDYILAVGEFKRLRLNYPNSPLADDAHYMTARSYFLDSPGNVGLEQDGVKDAIREIENFFEDFPNSAFRQNARELLDSCYCRLAHKDYKNGEVYYKIGDYQAARIYLEDVVTKYSCSEWVGKSLYRLGEIDYKEENYKDSRAKFKNFLNAFPEHEWAGRAAKRLEKVEEKLNEIESLQNERAQE